MTLEHLKYPLCGACFLYVDRADENNPLTVTEARCVVCGLEANPPHFVSCLAAEQAAKRRLEG